jgi:hypothetical protein
MLPLGATYFPVFSHGHRRPAVAGRDVEKQQEARASGLLCFGEIQFHADAVGVVEEELCVAGARHDAFAEFHVLGL